MSEREDAIRVSVSPVPTDEEMAAISAVVATLLQQGNGETDEAGSRGGGRERWAQAGRREVLRPIDRDGEP